MLLQLLGDDPRLPPGGELRGRLGERVKGWDVGRKGTGLSLLLGPLAPPECRSGDIFVFLPVH